MLTRPTTRWFCSGTAGLAATSPGWLSWSVMLRRSDRYVLREMIGPFALALAGLILFILLNIILSLSDLMVDRGVSMPTLLRLVLLKIPSLLVVAVPMSVLFATFLGLGRMVHDRETVALESLGISLRRVLLPLVLAASAIAAADFAVYNWLVPASESAYQDALRTVIFRQGVPRITSNAFFKGPNDQFLYIRRYEESTGRIYDVHIYDTTGQLFAKQQTPAQLTMLTADEGVWSDGSWNLTDAHVYGFDREGNLTFSAVVDSLILPVDQGVSELLSRSRTTSEMGIGELWDRVGQGRANGQRVDEYLVEIHLKMALPLAAVIFVLLSGSLSLAFLPRGRAVGIVLGLLLVAVYQGVLWWTQTLGRRGAMNPALAAWLPDILFGAVGLVLFFRVDRLASRDVWSRVRARIPFLVLPLLALVSIAPSSLGAEAVPVHMDCDELFLSEDGTLIRATGSASATFEGTAIRADLLVLEQVQSSSWRISASGNVALDVGEEIFVQSDTLVAEVDTETGAVLAHTAQATSLAGSTSFTNSEGTNVELFFRAERGELRFEEGRVALLEAFGSELTTCNCSNTDLREQPYSLRAERLLLYPDRLFVAFSLTGRAAGVGLVWLPLYVQPLKETLEAPLFPAVGKSAARGWFAKWSLPFFLNETVYGNVNVDFFTRYAEVGLGGTLRYDLRGHSGELSAYRFPAKVGDSETALHLRHTADLLPGWEATGRFDYDAQGNREKLSYAFQVAGSSTVGNLTLQASRALQTTATESTRVDERLPELTLNVTPIHAGPLEIAPRLSAGWLNEGILGEPLQQAFRLFARADATADAFDLGALRVTPQATAQASAYDGPQGEKAQITLALTPTATMGDFKLAWTSTWVAGASPFDSDRAKAGHELRWAVERKALFDVTLAGSYNLATGFGPIQTTLAWEAGASWSVSAAFDPVLACITQFALTGTWKDGVRTATWKLPFDATSRRFARTSLSVGSELGNVSLSARADASLAPFSIDTLKIDGAIESPEGWGLTVGATYSASATSTLRPALGVFRDIAQCLRVGMELAGSETWLYISILAFPEAVLRYAPRTFEVEVGT
jgi:LPS export ABC transporter permease LptG